MWITVSFILKLLATTQSVEAVLESYPELEAEDIQQALQYKGSIKLGPNSVR
jgi:uncharacterized protein (DUF433 family)